MKKAHAFVKAWALQRERLVQRSECFDRMRSSVDRLFLYLEESDYRTVVLTIDEVLDLL